MQPRRPYMFFLPDPELIKAGCKGDHIKAIIRAVPPSEKYGAERMWIRVTSARSDWLEGLLDSNPMTPELHGAILRWPRSRVVEVLLGDPARTPPKRKYWVAAFAQTRPIRVSLKNLSGRLPRSLLHASTARLRSWPTAAISFCVPLSDVVRSDQAIPHHQLNWFTPLSARSGKLLIWRYCRRIS